jgi:hypothetical protein
LAKRVLIFLGLRKPVTPIAPPTAPIPWGEVDIGALPGVVTGPTLADVVAKVERSNHSDQSAANQQFPAKADRYVQFADGPPSPRLVNSVAGYNVVEYEGWYYGMPQALGDIHLEKVDVLEMPGVIRDLSQEVVENEIREMAS